MYIYINKYINIYIRIWICILYLYYMYMLQKNILVVSVSHYCYSKSTICYHNIMHIQKNVPVDSWVHIYFSNLKIAQETCMSSCLSMMRCPHVCSIHQQPTPLRCLHSILSLFKRTWRFRRHFFWLPGEPWRFSDWTTHLRQMPRWFFCKPTRSHHAKKLLFKYV